MSAATWAVLSRVRYWLKARNQPMHLALEAAGDLIGCSRTGFARFRSPSSVGVLIRHDDQQSLQLPGFKQRHALAQFVEIVFRKTISAASDDAPSPAQNDTTKMRIGYRIGEVSAISAARRWWVKE